MVSEILERVNIETFIAIFQPAKSKRMEFSFCCDTILLLDLGFPLVKHLHMSSSMSLKSI